MGQTGCPQEYGRVWLIVEGMAMPPKTPTFVLIGTPHIPTTWDAHTPGPPFSGGRGRRGAGGAPGGGPPGPITRDRRVVFHCAQTVVATCDAVMCSAEMHFAVALDLDRSCVTMQ